MAFSEKEGEEKGKLSLSREKESGEAKAPLSFRLAPARSRKKTKTKNSPKIPRSLLPLDAVEVEDVAAASPGDREAVFVNIF